MTAVHQMGSTAASASGCRDLNPGPPAPKAGALPSCATARDVRGVVDNAPSVDNVGYVVAAPPTDHIGIQGSDTRLRQAEVLRRGTAPAQWWRDFVQRGAIGPSFAPDLDDPHHPDRRHERAKMLRSGSSRRSPPTDSTSGSLPRVVSPSSCPRYGSSWSHTLGTDPERHGGHWPTRPPAHRIHAFRGTSRSSPQNLPCQLLFSASPSVSPRIASES